MTNTETEAVIRAADVMDSVDTYLRSLDVFFAQIRDGRAVLSTDHARPHQEECAQLAVQLRDARDMLLLACCNCGHQIQ